MEYNRKRVIKDNSMLFGLKGWMELSLTEIKKAVDGAVFGRKIRNAILDMLSLR